MRESENDKRRRLRALLESGWGQRSGGTTRQRFPGIRGFVGRLRTSASKLRDYANNLAAAQAANRSRPSTRDETAEAADAVQPERTPVKPNSLATVRTLPEHRMMWVCHYAASAKWHLVRAGSIDSEQPFLLGACGCPLDRGKLGRKKGKRVCRGCAAFAVQNQLSPPWNGQGTYRIQK